MITFAIINVWIAVLAFIAMKISQKWGLSPSKLTAIIIAGVFPAVFSLVSTWLSLSTPEALSVVLPPLGTVQTLQDLPQSRPELLIIFKILYFTLAAVFLVRTLRKWFALQCLQLISTADPKVFLTDENMPPLTLSWPRRSIVLPTSLSVDSHEIIIAHEQAHLQHYDAELTLLFLCLKDIFWINPAFAWLVRQWRYSVELRADRAVTLGTDLKFRRAYADTLLSVISERKGGQALPCPSASLTSNRTRSVKMRLFKIMTEQNLPRKSNFHPVAKLALWISTLAVGLTISAAAGTAVNDKNEQPLIRFPPVMPASCPGLDASSIDIVTKTFKVSGEAVTQRVAQVGRVVLKFDVDEAGAPQNITVIKSNHNCFVAPAKSSVAKWRYSKNAPISGVENMIVFMLSENGEGSLKKDLQEFSK